ncbi:NUDIX domain-containing protein [Bacteroidota bacterium]
MGKKLTVVDDNDNVIGSATRKETKEKKLNWRFAAILIFNSKGEMLIGKRPGHLRAYPDKWTYPAGGKVDYNESYLEAAKREMMEEIGVEMDLKKKFEYSTFSSSEGKIFVQVFSGIKEDGFKPNPKEVEEIKWVTKEWLKKDIESNPDNYTQPFIQGFSSYLKANKKI